MTHDISNPTHLMLNSRCEFFYSAGNMFAPLGHCTVGRLAEALDRFGKVEINVEYRTYGTDEQQAADVKKYTKRIRSLPACYMFTGFSPKVIDGHVIGVMTGRLSRSL